jgi:predicted ribosome quality control (RQC) complex YloA/Tae2 family protein
VIEYNCRFGDPETQVVLPLLESDLFTIMQAVAAEKLADVEVKFRDGAACCVVLASDGEADEPTERDFTQAAMIAAYYSKVSDGVMVPVDYTRVRYVKKPSGAKPGFVTYTTNWTAYVTPEKETVERMKVQ